MFAPSLSGLSGLGALILLAKAIDALMRSGSGYGLWLGLALLLTLVMLTLKGIGFLVSHLAAFHLETLLRTSMAEHLARVPLGYLIQTGSGALAKVLQDDVKALHAFVADSTPFFGRAFAMPLFSLLFIFWLDYRMALASLAVLFFGISVMMVAMRDHEKLSQCYDNEREYINATIIEFVQAMPVVRTFDDGNSSFGRYQQALDRFHQVLTNWLKQSSLSARAGMILLSPLPTLLVLIFYGLYLYQVGTLDLATWIATLLIGSGMAESIMPLMWLNHFIRKAQASAVRIQEILLVPALPQVKQSQQPKDASIVFNNVSFSYDSKGKEALTDISFSVPSGTITALVGPSGAGKSTVAKLIPRFWDVSAGAIRIGQQDIRDIPSDVLMSHVSFVFQDTFLFHDTLANNIRLGLPDATHQEIEAAARAAQAHDFIVQLPDGYDTIAGERGSRLSGGQRQRITIARAMLQNRPIVVLDEATAFADPENEAALVKALSYLMQDKTVIIIAHRLATIMDADQILVFDQGQLVEKGTHSMLQQENGIYARLWRNYEHAQGWSVGRTNLAGGKC